jgi:hypothetical protein
MLRYDLELFALLTPAMAVALLIITVTVLLHVSRHWRDHDDHTNH